MSNNKKLTNEEIKALTELGDVLRIIAERLIKEGKAKIVDGKVVFLKRYKSKK